MIALLVEYTNDTSSIVKALAMQAMADIALCHPAWLGEVRRHIDELIVIGTPAMRARGRKLSKLLAARAAIVSRESPPAGRQ